MSKTSRLDEVSQKRSQRNLIIILTGIIFLIILFFFYGVPLLISLSILADKLRGNKDSFKPVSASYIAPPIFDPLREATNSARITVSGYSLPEQVVKLYLNGRYIGQTNVNDNKTFKFKNIKLDSGNNDIKAKAVISDKESSYSEIIHIVYKNKEPNLEVTSPKENQSISNGDGFVKVEGKTDPSVRVTVNDYWAIVDTDGNFSYLLHLQKGENTIKIVATDDATNKSEKQIRVKLE